jgi:hypothetical protein
MMAPVAFWTKYNSSNHQCAAHQVAVAADVLGGRVHDDVGAQFQRPGEHRRGEGIVDPHQHPLAVRDLDASGDIGDRHPRIARAFQPQQLGAGRERGFQGAEIRRVGERHRDSGAVGDFMQQAVGAAVDVAAGDDMVAAFERRDHAMRGCHAAGKGQGPHAALERGERGLEGFARRIAAPRVVVLAPLAGAGLHEGRRNVQRRYDRAGLRVVLVADVNGAGAEFHRVNQASRNGSKAPRTERPRITRNDANQKSELKDGASLIGSAASRDSNLLSRSFA